MAAEPAQTAAYRRIDDISNIFDSAPHTVGVILYSILTGGDFARINFAPVTDDKPCGRLPGQGRATLYPPVYAG
jgi:hypothetical protein